MSERPVIRILSLVGPGLDRDSLAVIYNPTIIPLGFNLSKSHNTSLSLPQNFLHNHCLQFLRGHADVPREIKNNAYANSWG